jgi:hypothetical protein
MATIHVTVPDALKRRMDGAGEQDWSAVAQRAFESHLQRMEAGATAGAQPGAAAEKLRSGKPSYEEVQKNAGYEHGYAWARDRAHFHDLQTMVDAPDYRSAANVVRRSEGFSQRDEFGDTSLPSEEMWEGFIDGATALYNEVADDL